MTAESREALKPCPFCGGKAYLLAHTHEDGDYVPEDHDPFFGFEVGCTKCSYDIVRSGKGKKDKQRAIAHWNTRHIAEPEANEDELVEIMISGASKAEEDATSPLTPFGQMQAALRALAKAGVIRVRGA